VNATAGNLETLESSLLAEIASAGDEAAIEAVRVAALGKKGSVSEILKTLGSMTPEERQTKGPAINGLKNRITEALAARKSELKDAAIAARLTAETLDVTLPVRQSPAERGRIHPISQVIDVIASIVGDM
jgi:phenylalanyl-tRNA synthetase alpha chain